MFIPDIEEMKTEGTPSGRWLFISSIVLVEHIAFGDGQQALLVEQFRIILGQFAQQDRVILADVVAVGRNHKEEHRIAFDMAQETGSQSLAFVSSFDDARYIGHDERMVIAALDDTQVGFERREGIVGDLGLCSGNDRKERAFARVREPHQSHVSQHLQFENESSLDDPRQAARNAEPGWSRS